MKYLVRAVTVIGLGIGSIAFSACEVGPRVDGKQVQTEMNDRKIRRISKAQFTEAVLKLGDSIIYVLDSTQKLTGNNQAITFFRESQIKNSVNIIQYEVTLLPKAQMVNEGGESKNKQSSFLDAGIYAFENKQLKEALVQQSDTSWVYISNWIGKETASKPDTLGIVMVNFPLKPLIRKMNIKGVK